MARRSRDAEAELNLPPGFRFHPTDEELVVHYLCRKATHQFLPVPIIAEVDLYKYDPWQLPDMALFGQKEWYFFTPRDRKYPNGSRPNRAAGTGYWKATGADKPVTPEGSSKPLGIKKALVFYAGKAPRGVKTNWIMHEYRLADSNRTNKKKGSLRLDDWVLCRLYNKKNNWETERQQYQQKQHQQKSEQTEDRSFTDTMDSFEAVEDVASDSHRTAESDIDNDEYVDFAGKSDPGATAMTSNATAGGGAQTGKMIKEDNDWFMELNLDDLHNTFAAFGGGNTAAMDMPLYQDYSFSTLLSPLPKSSSQLNFSGLLPSPLPKSSSQLNFSGLLPSPLPKSSSQLNISGHLSPMTKSSSQLNLVHF